MIIEGIITQEDQVSEGDLITLELVGLGSGVAKIIINNSQKYIEQEGNGIILLQTAIDRKDIILTKDLTHQ